MASSPVASFKDTFGSSNTKDHDSDNDYDENEDMYSPFKQMPM